MKTEHLRPKEKDLLDPFSLTERQELLLVDQRLPDNPPRVARLVRYETVPEKGGVNANRRITHTHRRTVTFEYVDPVPEDLPGADHNPTITIDLSPERPYRTNGEWVGNIRLYRHRRQLANLIAIHHQKWQLVQQICTLLHERDATLQQLTAFHRVAAKLPLRGDE